jgi:hypothetical protein
MNSTVANSTKESQVDYFSEYEGIRGKREKAKDMIGKIFVNRNNPRSHYRVEDVRFNDHIRMGRSNPQDYWEINYVVLNYPDLIPRSIIERCGYNTFMNCTKPT